MAKGKRSFSALNRVITGWEVFRINENLTVWAVIGIARELFEWINVNDIVNKFMYVSKAQRQII